MYVITTYAYGRAIRRTYQTLSEAVAIADQIFKATGIFVAIEREESKG